MLISACAGVGPIRGAGLDELYVSPDGNDAWSGTLAAPNAARTDGPFASLERARDGVRIDGQGSGVAGCDLYALGDGAIENNIFVDCDPAVHVDARGEGWMKTAFYAPADTIMTTLKEADFRLKPDSPALKLGFQPIPVHLIGLVKDQYRLSIPP
jgi:hypothetical protein